MFFLFYISSFNLLKSLPPLFYLVFLYGVHEFDVLARVKKTLLKSFNNI
jgi:hypothetical protein